jgi:hypothetical protein
MMNPGRKLRKPGPAASDRPAAPQMLAGPPLRHNETMFIRCRGACAALVLCCIAATPAPAEEWVQLDPFAQVTHGFPACPQIAPPLLRPDQARNESHVRVERGLRCAMEGKCEPGGAYKRDPEINERMRAAIAGDPRFSDTSLWVTTSRKWVTLEGCVKSTAQRKALVAFVAGQRDVERVFDEVSIGTKPARGSAR